MEKRVWIRSGIVEELDAKQQRLIELVLEKIELYYRHLHGTRPVFQYPLSLSRLMKLCNRNSYAVTLALKYLANTVPLGSNAEPPIYYDRTSAQRNKSHRPYRIFLRKRRSGARAGTCSPRRVRPEPCGVGRYALCVAGMWWRKSCAPRAI
jgi:hypothetical protein